MADEFPWDDLLDLIDAGEVMPIVGGELVRAEYLGRRVSLTRLLAERLAEREKLDIEWRGDSELNDAACAYLEKPRAKLVELYGRIAGTLRALSPPFPIPSGLLRLAQIERLDLFVTLTFDSLLARALDQTRFKGNPVTQELEFSINQSTAAQSQMLNVRPGAAPIVFNLLGRAGSKADFAVHDEDVLEFIHKFVSGDVAPPDWLLSELRNRHLLVLGVHLPDWVGRFVLRAATKDRLWLARREYFIARESGPADAELATFLNRFGRDTRISVFEGDAETFVEELARRWTERHPRAADDASAQTPRADSPRGSIFISYGRENLASVERLHGAIEELGGEAWFDRAELAPGDDWEKKILPQIQREVRLFVPVISELTGARDEGYVFREWREALDRAKKIIGRRFIVPIVVDAEYHGDLGRYQRLVDEFPALRELHFGSAPGGVPDEDLRRTLTQEIRALRREESR